MAKASAKPHDLKEAPTLPPDNQASCQPTTGSVAGGGLSANPGSFDFLAPAQAPDEIGRLGPYRVLKVLGQGGMGVVFRAEDVRLGRPVALKAMRVELAQNPGARERFLREARAVAALEHDNIVAIHQVDEDRGVPYIAMPLLKGMSLEDWLKTKQPGGRGTPLKAAQVLKIGREIARGLAAAHARGLIHRDIKPGNIWLDATAGGRVKLLDFGLARSTGGEQNLTQSGAIVGTPAYMAPEQAQGQKLDGRADLFSLGVVLYRLCTGELPFRGQDMISTLMALATHEPPPPQTLNPGLPGRLSDLVMKLLVKDPARRLGSAQEAVQELLAIEKDQAPAPTAADPPTAVTPAAPPKPRPAAPARVPPRPRKATPAAGPARQRRRRWPLVVACLALVAVPLGIYLAATVIRVDTAEGTLVIDVNDPEVLVTVKQNGVSLYDKVKDRTFTVTAGKGVVEVYEKDGVGPLKTEKFTLNRGGKETVHVRLEPRVARAEPKQAGAIEQPAGKATGGEKSPARPDAERPALLRAPFGEAKAREAQQAWAKFLGRKVEETVDLGSGVTMEFVLIPPGTFTMGSPKEELQRFDNEDEHEVTLPSAFYLGKYAVTQEQYQRLMDANPSHFSPKGAGATAVAGQDTRRFPVEMVSWNDAVAFCTALEQNTGLKAGLPSEAQWEYACRAGTTTPFHFGSSLNGSQANCNGNPPYGTTEKGPYLQRTCAVGSYRPNAFGLYDMHGNVWQWCEDSWNSFRVFRGGCWGSAASVCRAAFRGQAAPTARNDYLGFRLARVPSRKPAK